MTTTVHDLDRIDYPDEGHAVVRCTCSWTGNVSRPTNAEGKFVGKDTRDADCRARIRSHARRVTRP